MTDEAQIVIGDETYPFPTLDTWDIDESIILYEYSGITIDELGDARRAKHPGVLKAFMHVAVRRRNRQSSEEEIRELVGSANLIETLEVFARMGDDESPPEESLQKNEHVDSESSDEPSRSSGDAGVSASEILPVGNGHTSTGAPDSPRSVISAQEISAA